MSRTALMEQTKMPTFEEATRKNLLVPLSVVPPAATVLYVSHRWAGPGKADSDDGHTHMQVRASWSELHAGMGVGVVMVSAVGVWAGVCIVVSVGMGVGGAVAFWWRWGAVSEMSVGGLVITRQGVLGLVILV